MPGVDGRSDELGHGDDLGMTGWRMSPNGLKSMKIGRLHRSIDWAQIESYSGTCSGSDANECWSNEWRLKAMKFQGS